MSVRYRTRRFGATRPPLIFRPGRTRLDPNIVYWQDFRAKTLVPRVGGVTAVFDRASEAADFDNFGVLQTAASGAPRYGYTYHAPNWIPRGLLVEEQRENVCLHSKALDNAVYTGINSDVPTTNNASPDGANNADEIAATSTADQQVAIHQSFTGLTAGQNTVVSAHVKAGTNATFVQLAWDSDGSGGDGCFCNFNLSTGVAGTVTAMTAGTATSASIIDISGGYFLCVVVGKIAAGTVGRFTLNIVDRIDAAKFEAADLADNDSIIATDLQVEKNDVFWTSRIATTTAAVTKVRDRVTLPSVPFWNQSAGTIYIRGYMPAPMTSAQNPQLMQVDDGGSTDRFILGLVTGKGRIQTVTSVGNAALVTTANSFTAPAAFQYAAAYAQDNAVAARGGVLSAIDSSCDFPLGDTLTGAIIGGQAAIAGTMNGYISEIIIWNVRKPDAFVKAITT